MSVNYVRSEPSQEELDTRVWRYMELDKLIRVLADGAIFLPRTDKLNSDDPWEPVADASAKHRFQHRPHVGQQGRVG